MKKILNVFLVVLLLALPVFGAVVDTADFEISTKVDPVAVIQVFDGETAPTVENWNTLTALTEYEFTEGNLTEQFYVAVKTNLNKNLTINVDALHMTAEDVDTHIGYKIESISSTQVSQKQLLTKEELSTFSMRIISVATTITLNEAEYSEAVEGTYKAVLVFEVVSD